MSGFEDSSTLDLHQEITKIRQVNHDLINIIKVKLMQCHAMLIKKVKNVFIQIVPNLFKTKRKN